MMKAVSPLSIGAAVVSCAEADTDCTTSASKAAARAKRMLPIIPSCERAL
jgi:hypothetical protein